MTASGDQAAVIMQMFATPVARVAWPGAERFNGQLADLVLANLDPSGDQYTYKSETISELTGWGDPVISALTAWVLRVARQFAETVSGRKLDEAFAGAGHAGEPAGRVAVTVGRSWASVYRKGDRHEAHFHPNTALTAIYYVEAPDSCELDLVDPRPNIDYYDPGVTLAGEGHRVRLRSRPGDLLLFPGWLKHAVTEFQAESVRISLSWNLGYARESAGAA